MIKAIKIKAGSILTWKEYSWFEILCKGRLKLLPNRAWISTEDTTLLLDLKKMKDLTIYEPKKPFSKNESEQLREEISAYMIFQETFNNKGIDYTELVQLINNVRPDTIRYNGNLVQLNWYNYFKTTCYDN